MDSDMLIVLWRRRAKTSTAGKRYISTGRQPPLVPAALASTGWPVLNVPSHGKNTADKYTCARVQTRDLWSCV